MENGKPDPHELAQQHFDEGFDKLCSSPAPVSAIELQRSLEGEDEIPKTSTAGLIGKGSTRIVSLDLLGAIAGALNRGGPRPNLLAKVREVIGQDGPDSALECRPLEPKPSKIDTLLACLPDSPFTRQLKGEVEVLRFQLKGMARAVDTDYEQLYRETMQWKEAVISELVICHILNESHGADPRKALKDAIDWNVQIALDPQVSSDAQDLIEKGRALGQVTVSANGLREAIDLINPDGPEDKDQAEEGVTLRFFPAGTTPLGAGVESLPEGVYARIAGYPEEGWTGPLNGIMVTPPIDKLP